MTTEREAIETVVRAEQKYMNNPDAFARVNKAAGIMELAVMDHTKQEMPEEHRGLIRLAMVIYDEMWLEDA